MKRYNLFGLLFLLLFGACSYLDDYSQDLVVAKNVEHLDELMIGSCYFKSENLTSMASGEVAWFLNILDDDVNTVGVLNKRADEITNMNSSYFGYTTWQYEVGRSLNGSNLQADNGTWNALYQHINAVNVVLSELDNIDIPTDEEAIQATRIRGECHFLRAQFYFLLVNLYGNAYAPATAAQTLGVPLKLTAYVEHDKDKETQFTRATQAEVYAQIVSDLQQAIACFEAGEVSTYRKIYRANREAAQLLLSRAYLYMQDWENARTAAQDFLDMGVGLEPIGGELTGPFLNEDNSEILFSQGSQHLQNVLTANAPDFCVTAELYNLYDDNDYRKSFFQVRDSIALINKYEMDGEDVLSQRVSDIMPLRVAEGYLNMAEACAMLDDPEANTYLNTLRSNRIGGYETQTYSGEELISQIRDERLKELCFEGHRWFDLRRYTVNTKLPFRKSITHSFHVYNTGIVGIYLGTRVFRLEADEDRVWTFSIPQSVLEFDRVPMPNNERDAREPIEDSSNDEEEDNI